MGYEKQLDKFAMSLTIKDVSEINRVLGIIEGLTYAVQDDGVANGFINAIERIEAVINRGGDGNG